jgi:hypothetical protein
VSYPLFIFAAKIKRIRTYNYSIMENKNTKKQNSIFNTNTEQLSDEIICSNNQDGIIAEELRQERKNENLENNLKNLMTTDENTSAEAVEQLIIAIVGSRTINDYNLIERVILQHISIEKIGEIVSGGAIGVDTLARKFAKKHNIKMTEFYPDRKRFGRKAAHLRNTTIIQHCDRCFAFIKNNSSGTRDSIRKCRAMGKPCLVTTLN